MTIDIMRALESAPYSQLEYIVRYNETTRGSDKFETQAALTEMAVREGIANYWPARYDVTSPIAAWANS